MKRSERELHRWKSMRWQMAEAGPLNTENITSPTQVYSEQSVKSVDKCHRRLQDRSTGFRIRPAAVVMIDHLFRHTAIHHEVLSGDEAALLIAKEENGMHDICRRPHPPRRMLGIIGALECRPGGVNPSR